MRSLRAPLLMLVASVLLAGPALAAPNNLRNGTITPDRGTTATTFTFSVDYAGANDATGITAVAPGLVVTLTLINGGAASGTWTTSRTLPAGSWTFTFHATVTGQNPPTLAGPTIVVAGPTPPPPPTPGPTARPTPRPTPAPGTTATPAVSPPFGTPLASPSGSPSGSETGAPSTGPSGSGSPSPSPAVAPPGAGPFNVPAEGVVAIGLLGAVTVAAALGERRRRRAVEAFRAAEASMGDEGPRGADLDAGWEDEAVEDETVATIDYEGLDDSDPSA